MAFMVAGYTGSPSIMSRLPAFAIVAFVGALGGPYLNSSTLSKGCVAQGRYRLSVNLVLSPGRTLTNR